MKVQGKLLPNGSRLPERSKNTSVGLDCFMPNDGFLQPGMNVVPLGFTVDIPMGHEGIIVARSSAARLGISTEAVPIDPTYKGEVHAFIINHTISPTSYLKDHRIVQLVIRPIIHAELVNSLEQRGAAAFGSTGV